MAPALIFDSCNSLHCGDRNSLQRRDNFLSCFRPRQNGLLSWPRGNDVSPQPSDKTAAVVLSSADTGGNRAVGAFPAQAKEDEGPITATLTAPVEALLHEQVAKRHFPSLDRAL